MDNAIIIFLKILLFALVFTVFISLGIYVNKFKIFQLIAAKIKTDAFEYDRIRREQMKKDLRRRNNFLQNEDSLKLDEKTSSSSSFFLKIYDKIRMTGITTKIPGFSEILFIGTILFVTFLILFIASIVVSPIVGIGCAILFLFLVYYVISLIVYARRINVESQLLQFTNACASASRQYSNIVDIIGSIYDQFTGAFREALEACYVEAKALNDKEKAFENMKDKFDSTQLAFVIDNFDTCSSLTGDYYSVATDLSKTVAIFTTSRDKRAVTLRNAKIHISVMFGVALIIMYSLGTFFESGLSILTGTPIGILLIVALIGIFLFGLNIKAE